MIKHALFIFSSIIALKTRAQLNAGQLPLQETLYGSDWLIQPVKVKAFIYTIADKKDIILYNGLVKRAFRLTPNVV